MKALILTPGFGDNAPTATLYYGQDVRRSLRLLPAASVDTVCTSPPYWGLRDYGTGDAQIGLEDTVEAYVESLVEVFREIRRVLRPDGTVWLNLGDSYATSGLPVGNPDKHGGELRSLARPRTVPKGLKPKDLIGIPWRVAFALQADGWYLRSDIIWAKPNPMPESVTDRPTKAHEYLFLMSKSAQYYYDNEAIKEPYASADTTSASYRKNGKSDSRKKHPIHCPACAGKGVDGDTGIDCEVCLGSGLANIGGAKTAVKNEGFWKPEGTGRNKRDVWTVSTHPYKGAHFAVWPPELIRPMILAGCPTGGVVLDPFSGSATTGMVSLQEGRNYIGVDLNADYLDLATARVEQRRAPQDPEPCGGPDVFELFGGSK